MHQLWWIVPKSGFLGLFSSCRSFASSWCLSLMAAGLKLSTKLVQVVRSKASQRQTSKMQLGCSAMQTDFDCSCINWCILQLDHVLPLFTMFYQGKARDYAKVVEWLGRLKTSMKGFWVQHIPTTSVSLTCEGHITSLTPGPPSLAQARQGIWTVFRDRVRMNRSCPKVPRLRDERIYVWGKGLIVVALQWPCCELCRSPPQDRTRQWSPQGPVPGALICSVCALVFSLQRQNLRDPKRHFSHFSVQTQMLPM